MTIRLCLCLGLVAASATAASGCAGDVDEPPGDMGVTRSSPLTAGTPDSECYRNEVEDGGAVETTTGSTGHVEIEDFFIGGVFYADDAILRAKGHPECVAHIESPAEAFAAAGTLIVTSNSVETPEGPPAPFVINPNARNEYVESPDPPLFLAGGGTNIRVELTGSPDFPPIPASILRSSAFGPINVTVPRLSASCVLALSSTAPFRFDWDVPRTGPPRAGRARHPESVSMRLLALGPARWSQLYCSWPTVAGHGRVPASLLREFRRQLGGTGAVDAVVDMYSGELKEVVTANSSYVVFATTDDATTLPRSTSATFE